MDAEAGQGLTREEKARIREELEYSLSVMEDRYNLRVNEVIDAVKWVQERRAFADRVKQTSAISLIGVLITTALIALWEGIRMGAK